MLMKSLIWKQNNNNILILIIKVFSTTGTDDDRPTELIWQGGQFNCSNYLFLIGSICSMIAGRFKVQGLEIHVLAPAWFDLMFCNIPLYQDLHGNLIYFSLSLSFFLPRFNHWTQSINHLMLIHDIYTTPPRIVQGNGRTMWEFIITQYRWLIRIDSENE